VVLPIWQEDHPVAAAANVTQQARQAADHLAQLRLLLPAPAQQKREQERRVQQELLLVQAAVVGPSQWMTR